MAVTPVLVTTKLEAVNAMLGAIGADPVNSLSITVDSDVTNAKRLLEETLREVQSQGWDFNTDKRYAMARTVDNEYVVPDNVAEIDVSDEFPWVRATRRGNKIWDQVNHTFTWDVDLTFNVVWLFDFEEIPQTARQYIMLKAARKFQGQELGSDNLGRYTEKNEQDAEAIFKDAEGTDAGHNILTGNYSVYRTLDRRVD
jgi:hypothetical protein